MLTAPLTETIDHAGYFIQMSMASLPIWLEGILNRKYPKWRERRAQRGRHRRATCRPACACSKRRCCATSRPDDIVACYPGRSGQVHRPRHARRRRLDAQPAGRHVRGRRLHVDLRLVQAADQLALRAADVRRRSRRARTATNFKVIVGGSGGWQITQTNACDELGVDCVVEGRSESAETLDAVRQGDRAARRCRGRSTSAIRRTATRSSSPTSARRSASSR